MAEINISCNLASCRKKLNHSAFVTTCKHIFCLKHLQREGRDAIKENQHVCLACGGPLHKEFDVVEVNLNPNHQYKSMVLIGLNPEQIMEIATRAINFYSYQVNYSKRNKDDIIQHLNEQNQQIKTYCETAISKYKSELSRVQRNIEKAKFEIKEKMNEIEYQRKQIAECQETVKKLQFQNESYKQKLLGTQFFGNNSQLRRGEPYCNQRLYNLQNYPETVATSLVLPHFNPNRKTDSIFDESAYFGRVSQ